MTLIGRPIEDVKAESIDRSASGVRFPWLKLLSGGASLEAFSKAVGRSVLQLPLTQDRTILSCWQEHAAGIGQRSEVLRKLVRIIGGHPMHAVDVDKDSITAPEYIADPQEHRGTGGVLRDIAADYPDDAYLLVANAATLLLEPLEQLLAELLRTEADAAFFVCDDNSASSLMLLRCACLRSIPAVGFVDLKEQAMPIIASNHSVALVRRRMPIGISIRTPAKYIHGLRAYQQLQASSTVTDNCAFAEQWQSAFAIVESGAEIGQDVRLHDSVVLKGARVGRGAVVVRSLVCPGAVVPAGALVVDQVVRPRV